MLRKIQKNGSIKRKIEKLIDENEEQKEND